MKDSTIIKSPFFRLLMPLLIGILLQYYFPVLFLSVICLASGAAIALFSFFTTSEKAYSFRWLFGVGISLLLVSIGSFSTQMCQRDSAYSYSPDKIAYRGIVLDVPKEKTKSVAAEVNLVNKDLKANKKIVCYFSPDGVSRDLKPGDEILLYGEIQPIRNFGNNKDFDYKKYMYNKGFSGTIYLSSDRWEPTFRSRHNIQTYALKCRNQILEFFKSLGLNDTELSLVAALTLGYQDNIPDNIKESFRATGTAHVLAVSGMHVAIIFGCIMFLLGFIHRSSPYKWIKYVLIIILLWIYAFITGMPPSVIRACIMLTIFCFAEICNRKGFSYNTIFVAAFLILIFHPFSLFDIGFQLSFLAVFFIQYLNPRLVKLCKTDNKFVRYFWQLLTLSVAAQIGTMPLCLYYFGYFPTYFFITNLFVPLLVSVITYFIILIACFAPIPMLSIFVNYMMIALKFLIRFLTDVVQFFENLPLAKLGDLKISFISATFLFIIIFTITKWLEKKRVSYLIATLTVIVLLLTLSLPNKFSTPENELFVYSKQNKTEIVWNKAYDSFSYTIPDTVYPCKMIELKNKTFLIIADNEWKEVHSNRKITVDYLLITKGEKIELANLLESFTIKHIVLDKSLPSAQTRFLKAECEKHHIPYLDLKKETQLRISF